MFPVYDYDINNQYFMAAVVLSIPTKQILWVKDPTAQYMCSLIMIHTDLKGSYTSEWHF